MDDTNYSLERSPGDKQFTSSSELLEKESFESDDSLLNTPPFPTSPSRYKTSVLCLMFLLLGVIQTLPIAILIPESLDLGLTTGSASLIVAAWPAASLLVLVLQPLLNKVSIHVVQSRVHRFRSFQDFQIF